VQNGANKPYLLPFYATNIAVFATKRPIKKPSNYLSDSFRR